MTSLANEEFNGVALYGAGGVVLEVSTSEDGSQTLGLTQADITGGTIATVISSTLTAASSTTVSADLQTAIEELATMRAQNGSESSRVGFAQDYLNINALNLEAANSRIIDVDVASESSQLARFQILQQAGTAMLAQANTSQQSLVKLLQG